MKYSKISKLKEKDLITINGGSILLGSRLSFGWVDAVYDFVTGFNAGQEEKCK